MNAPDYTIISCYKDKVSAIYRNIRQYSGTIYTCWYIINGTVLVEQATQKLHAQSGEWVFIEPLTMRSHTFSESARILSIRFTARWNNLHFFPPLRAPWKISGADFPALSKSAAALCSNEIRLKSAGSRRTPADWARRTERFSAWLYHWHRVRESPDSSAWLSMDARVSRIFFQLAQTPGIAPTDYASLSSLTGLSKVQIDRIFKQSTGQTIKRWKATECLRAAENMLSDSAYSIKEIAATLRFSDASHFSKWFRQAVNISPQEWRHMQQAQLL